MSLFQEFKRRKVFRVAVVYAATAFAVLQGADIILPNLGVPAWAMGFLVVVVLLGFPIALVLAWALEVTPDGVKRTGDAPKEAVEGTPSLLGTRTLVVAGLLVAVGVGLSAGWVLKPGAGPVAEAESAGAVEVRASIAVLPFDNLSPDPEQGYFADGLTEEILNALAALPNLLVTARTSSFYYKDRNVPVDEIAARLGVDHVLEGSVRRSDEQMRVTAQLIRARDGFHLWSSTYDRPVDDAFTVQTDIATQVTSALGILLDERERDRMEAAGVRDPEAYALYARGFELYQLAHGDAPQIPTLMQANVLFDQAFARAPGLWAARFRSSDLYSHILLDLAAGTDESLPAAEIARARTELERRLRDASRAAPNQAARDFIEITRRMFSDDWTGLDELARRAVEHSEACGFDQWLHVAGLAFGMAEPGRDFFLRGARCNALDEYSWLHAAIASIYAGDEAGALEIAERGLEVANVTGFGLEEVRLTSLIALGRLDQARASLPRLEGLTNSNREQGEAWIAAARGDRTGLEAVRQRMTDAKTQAGIATQLYLAARLDEAGLAWPPTEAMDWPLKDW